MINAWWLGPLPAMLLFGSTAALVVFGAVFVGILLADAARAKSANRIRLPEPVEQEAYAAYESLSPDQRSQVTQSLRNWAAHSMTVKGIRPNHPFLYLASSLEKVRNEAWDAAWPVLRQNPGVAAALIGGLVRQYIGSFNLMRLWTFSEKDFSRLAQLGAPGRREFVNLLSPPRLWLGPTMIMEAIAQSVARGEWLDEEIEALRGAVASAWFFSEADRARVLEAIEHGRDMDLYELEKLVKLDQEPSQFGDLIRQARAAALAQDASTLAGRLRQGALDEGADELERAVASGDNDAAAIAAKRLKAQLDGSSRDAFGQNAFSGAMRFNRDWPRLAARNFGLLAVGAAFAALALYSASFGGPALFGMPSLMLMGISMRNWKDFSPGWSAFSVGVPAAGFLAAGFFAAGLVPHVYFPMLVAGYVSLNYVWLAKFMGTWGHQSRRVRRMLAGSAPDLSFHPAAEQSALKRIMDGFYGPVENRLRAIDEVQSARAEVLLPMVAVLARRDPSQRVALRAVEILAAWRQSSPRARGLLLEVLRDAKARKESRALARKKLVHDWVEAQRAREQAAREADSEFQKLGGLVDHNRQLPDLEALIREARAAALAQNVSTLTGRARRYALNEGADELEKAISAGDKDAAAIAAKRLKAQLGGSPRDAPGQNAFSMSYGFNSWTGIILKNLAVVAGAAAGLYAAWTSTAWGSALMMSLGGAGLVALAFYLKKKGIGSLAGGLFFLNIMYAFAGVGCMSVGFAWPWLAIPWVVINAFLLGKIYGAWGYQPRGVRRMLEQASPSLAAYPAKQQESLRKMMDGLYGSVTNRLRALEEIGTARGRELLPMVAVIARRDPSELVAVKAALLLASFARDDAHLLPLLEDIARDDHAWARSRFLAQGPIELARLERFRAEIEAQEEVRDIAQLLNKDMGTSQFEELIKEARAAALAQDASTLAGRLRQVALEEGAEALEQAVSSGDRDAAAIAAKRLKAQMDGVAQDAPGHNALSAAHAIKRFTARHPNLVVASGALLFTSSVLAVVFPFADVVKNAGGLLFVALFLSGCMIKHTRGWACLAWGLIFFAIIAAIPVAGTIILGMPWFGFGVVSAGYLALALDVIPARIREFSGGLKGEVRGALLSLKSSLKRDARKALGRIMSNQWDRAEAFSELRRDPRLAHELEKAFAVLLSHDEGDTNGEVIDILESWADEDAERLLGSVPSVYAVRALRRMRDAKAAVDEMSRLAQSVRAPAGEENREAEFNALAAAARAAARAQDVSTLAGSLRQVALAQGADDLIKAVSAGDRDAAAIAAKRLREQLASARQSGGSEGQNLLPHDPSRFRMAGGLGGKARLLWLGAFLSALLALSAGIGLPLLALWTSAPAAAVGAGAAWGGWAGWTLFKPFGDSTSKVQYASRNFNWPVKDTVVRLSARLGLAPEQSPRTGLYTETGKGVDSQIAGLNAYSAGKRLGPDALIAVGEALAREGSPVLDAVVAHELGHLASRDMVWSAAWRRLHRVAWMTAFGAGAFFAWSGVFGLSAVFAGLAVGLLASSYILGKGFSRAVELRADRFAADLVGVEAVRDMIRFFRGRVSQNGGLLETHPSFDRREAQLSRQD